MYKAPIKRVETIEQALGPDLRKLPIPEPSELIASALMRATHDAARLRPGEDAALRASRRRGDH
jgi:hypothetical protein